MDKIESAGEVIAKVMLVSEAIGLLETGMKLGEQAEPELHMRCQMALDVLKGHAAFEQ